MRIMASIRSKIWGCVWVALLAYIVATIATIVSNDRINSSLTHIVEVHFPLALKGERAFTLFIEQSNDLDNAVAARSMLHLDRAKELHQEIARLVNELVQGTGDYHTNFYPHLLALRDDYEDYFNGVVERYPLLIRNSATAASQRELQRMTLVREKLRSDFEKISQQLTDTVVEDIESCMKRASSSSRNLQILFFGVLLVMAVVINLMASHLLIRPLERLREMMSDFSRGKHIGPPEDHEDGDEISALCHTFWRITEKLHEVSVSCRHLDNIIDNISDCLVVTDTDLKVQRVNRAARRLLGQDGEELEGRHLSQVVRADRTQLAPLISEVLAGRVMENVILDLCPSAGDRLKVNFSATPIYADDGKSLQSVVCLLRPLPQEPSQDGLQHPSRN